ncbi:helix-turn-helix domain-containing protein [Chryseolinea lacunae]|uniref:Helix-turn-helix domain-containing protein n=1 Tax=Chryseolinea lacunae TaxID=2801331 RepID=A0ABS1L213_9BACT|nr:helix-turn-helix domain-containing protein [Chryseolinea lacunae]MBL0745734.1 helix-turn-helix domain-containing protein [Chryseolinea lacunae]
MKERRSIAEFKFKPSLSLEFEIISIKDLYSKNKKQITLPHRANFYHIIWIEKGSPTHLVDFHTVKVPRNSILFVNKLQVHLFDSSEKYDGKLILFTDRFFCKNQDDIDFLNTTVLFNDLLETVPLKLDGISNSLQSLIQLVGAELASDDDPIKRNVLRNYLHAFLLLCDREKRRQGFRQIPKGADRDYSMLFSSLVNEHFSKIRSVYEYAEMMHVPEKRLSRATAHVLGKSPKELISERVLLEIKRLLVHTNKSIKEIGFDLGFNEPSNFIKYFRQQAGQTPSEFREKHLGELSKKYHS